MSQSTKNLKRTFSEASEEEFEPLTFGELKIGDEFIDFPLPGDNAGHGGFRGGFWIFIKTEEKKAKKKKNGAESSFPLSMLVIRIE